MPKRSLVFLLDQHYYNDHDGNGKKMKTRMDQLYDSWLSKVRVNLHIYPQSHFFKLMYATEII